MIGQMSNSWWVFVTLGICAGVLSGALGLGSGIVLVPTLVLLCGFEQKSAQGMALAVMVPMALVGALRYWQNPKIEMNAVVIGLIIIGALAGALVGAALAGRLSSSVLQRVLAIVLVVVAVRMFIASAKPGQPTTDSDLQQQQEINLVGKGKNDAGKQ
ncbi:MAG: TSUP family transporter [Planctomycetota bacterium]|jgi:uncharacterized membrane protein YfcA